jgi:uncharacterized membrane protein YagU involved in acid resistance
MVQTSRTIPRSQHYLATGAIAGLLAGAVAGQTNRFFDRFISPAQKSREKKVREASAHDLAGPYFAQKMAGRRLTAKEKRRARVGFSLAYGIVWGMVYAVARKKAPGLARWGGAPFSVPFFFACDGAIAPLLGISPSLRRIPWQPSAKEMGNHLAWTAAAELVHRIIARERKAS